MGRPKIKNIDDSIDLEKVKLPEESAPEEIETNAKDNSSEAADDNKKIKAKTKTKATKVKAEKKNKTSKRYSELLKLIDKSKTYSVEEAITLIKKSANIKFDSTVEIHVNLQTDPSKQEHQIRTTANLPHGNGKKVSILVFGAKDAKAVKDAGALVGTEETLESIEKGKINFQKIVSSPDWMPKLAKVAKVLGPKGLMPNPKSGTVSSEPEKVAAALNSGLVEIKTETSPIIHVTVGKVSFKEKDLEENIGSLLTSVKAAKPADFKKELISSVYITSTMGPSVKLELSSLN